MKASTMFQEIVKDLEKILLKLEYMDETIREKIGEVHNIIENCLYKIDSM